MTRKLDFFFLETQAERKRCLKQAEQENENKTTKSTYVSIVKPQSACCATLWLHAEYWLHSISYISQVAHAVQHCGCMLNTYWLHLISYIPVSPVKIDPHVYQKQEINFMWPYAIHEQTDTYASTWKESFLLQTWKRYLYIWHIFTIPMGPVNYVYTHTCLYPTPLLIWYPGHLLKISGGLYAVSCTSSCTASTHYCWGGPFPPLHKVVFLWSGYLVVCKQVWVISILVGGCLLCWL